MIDKIEIKYDQNIIEESKEYNQTSGRTMIIPTDYNLDKLEELWTKYNSQHKQLKREADWKSLELFGLNNQDHYEYLKTKYSDTIVPSDICANNNLFEFANIKSKDVEDENAIDISESMVLNKKDLEINLDKFEKGDSNVLLVTGFSGSGKSTLAKQLSSKYKCVYYELDAFDFYMRGNLSREEAIGNEDGLVSFIDKKKLKPNKNFNNKEYGSLFKEYIKFLINWCKKQKGKKFIIEGLQIYDLYEDGDTFITSCPMIIKGTSGLVSSIRAAKRNSSENNNTTFLKEFKPLVIWALKDSKKLNNFKKSLNESNIQESKDSSKLDPGFKKKSGKSFEFIDIYDGRASKYLTHENDVFTQEEHKKRHRTGEIVIDSKAKKLAGIVNVNREGIIGPLFVNKEYRGYGLGDTLIKDSIQKYGGNELGVYTDNEVAIKIYKKYGFKTYKSSKDKDGEYIIMRINASRINESEDKSYIDKNHKQNGHRKLSDFKLSKSQNKDEGKSYNLRWIDENNKTVGKVRVDTVPASDGYRWFGDLEVSKNYRGYGLGNQILKFVISEYKAGALAVYKDNQIAYNMYKKYGFEIGKNDGRDNDYYYMYLKKNKETANSSPKLEMSSFEYGCSLLENSSGIKRDVARLNLSLYEAKNLPESLRKEKVLGAEDPEENVGGFTLNRTRVDYPALPPDELLDLGVFSDDNYYAEYKALKIDENYCSKDWFDAYQKMCVGIYTEETDIIMKARHVKLMELCNELSNDPNNNQLKQYILELGWNPELPYTSGNRALVSRNTRNKLNSFYNEFSFIDVQGIEDIDYINEEVDEDSALYPVYIILLSSKTAFGKMIKKATNSIWTHGAISFDSKLDKIYSYARDGFVFENLDIYGKDSKLSVNVIFLNKKDYIKMKSRLDYFIANKKRTRYGFDNLLNVLTGKVKNHDLNLICTEFVDKLFKFIGIDLTHKSSNLVTPEDFSKTVKRNKKIYTVYNGFTGNYDKTKVDQRIAKLKASGRVFRELFTDKLCDSIIEKYTITPIVEVKEFPVQFDKEGNLLIKNIKKINYNEEYNKSHKLLREYEKTGNIDGMKYEISKLWFMYHLLEKHRYKRSLTKDELKSINDSRARIYNDFQKYLRIIQSKEKDFNFYEYYDSSPFSDSAYKFNASTIKYTKDFIKSLII